MVDVSKFLQRAEEAFTKRNFDYAIQMYLEALQVDPENIPARTMLRSVLLKADESGNKVKGPQGKTIILSNDPKVKLIEYEKAVVKEPRSVKYNMRVAEALAQIGAHEAAGHVYQYVISHCDKGKDNVEAMKKGAQAFIDSGKPEMAQKLLAMAMRHAPADKEIADLQRNLAATATLRNIQSAGSSREMLKDSGKAMELELLNKKVLSLPELKEAMRIVNDKLTEDPADKGMVKKKAELFGKARQYDKAYEWLMSRYNDLEKAPDIVELAVRYKNQDFDYKVKVCEKKMEEEPDKADAWKAKSLQLMKEKQDFELGEYKRQVDEAPADMDKRYLLGKALFEAKMFDDAVPHLQRASRSPKWGKVVGILLGRCFTDMGRLELATMQLTQTLEQISEVEEDLLMEARYWLGNVHEKSGKVDEAKKLFQGLFMENASFRDVGARLDKIQGRS